MKTNCLIFASTLFGLVFSLTPSGAGQSGKAANTEPALEPTGQLAVQSPIGGTRVSEPTAANGSAESAVTAGNPTTRINFKNMLSEPSHTGPGTKNSCRFELTSADGALQFIDPNRISFDSSRAATEDRPFVLTTADALRQARLRAGRAEFAEALAELNAQADKARTTELVSIDSAWWQQVKHQPWSQTYPIIYRKTCLEPLGMVRPAYYAALRYALTADADDAAAAKRILLHISRYSFEYEHYDVGMNYAVWGHLALVAYDILFQQFSTEQRRQMDAFFTRMAQAVLRNDIYCPGFPK